MWPIRRIVKYGIIGSTCVGTAISLHANDYNPNSIGLVRLCRAGLAVYDVALTYKRNLYYRDWDDQTSVEYKNAKSLTHKIASERLLKLICTNKGVYIKVGQHIGALEYLLPTEYVQTMKILHSKAPQNPVEDLYKVIRQDLKKEPDELFISFDKDPLGTASLAQVHRATLKTGEEVAVKVQHPYVRGNSIVDMKTMEILCKLMSWVFPEFKMQWLVDVSKQNLPIELNFLNEAKNAEKIAQIFRSCRWLRIPKIYWHLSTERVLVMEYLEGGQVDDLKYIEENKIDPFEVANKLGHLYAHMIFVNGFVHSDPHPGNILVKKVAGGTEIVLLDHGLYANLSSHFRYEYSMLWLSILRVDRKAMRAHSTNLGIKGDLYGLFACMVTGRPWESVLAGIEKKQQSDEEKEQLQSGTSLVLPHIADILDQVDRQMLLVLKTNDLIRGIEATLKTQNRMTSFWAMTKCCVRSVKQTDLARNAGHTWRCFTIRLHQNWAIFKLNAYYLFVGMKNMSLVSAVRQICL